MHSDFFAGITVSQSTHWPSGKQISNTSAYQQIWVGCVAPWSHPRVTGCEWLCCWAYSSILTSGQHSLSMVRLADWLIFRPIYMYWQYHPQPRSEKSISYATNYRPYIVARIVQVLQLSVWNDRIPIPATATTNGSFRGMPAGHISGTAANRSGHLYLDREPVIAQCRGETSHQIEHLSLGQPSTIRKAGGGDARRQGQARSRCCQWRASARPNTAWSSRSFAAAARGTRLAPAAWLFRARTPPSCRLWGGGSSAGASSLAAVTPAPALSGGTLLCRAASELCALAGGARSQGLSFFGLAVVVGVATDTGCEGDWGASGYLGFTCPHE